jgi:hypothetical protein
MEDKYNHLSVAEYGTNLAKLLCDQYFADHQTISGTQLISFTPIRQVNLFVIKELLVQWNREMANLRSPYFDFENEEVKAALVQFMNVLSRKILIRRPHFEPLLSKAVYDTYMVVLDPVSVLDEKFLIMEEDPTVASLQDNLKYLDIDKPLFADFFASLAASRLDRMYILDRFREYLNTHEQDRTNVGTLLEQFNRLLPVSRRDLTGKSPVLATEEPKLAAPAPAAPRPEPAQRPAGASIRLEREPALTRPAPAAPSPVRPMAPKPAVAADTNLNEKYKVEKPSRAEAYAKTTTTSSLAESQTNKPIQSLKDSISINQRYGFINELFNGENMQYHATIKKLDEFGEADAAKNYLLRDVAGKYDWSKKEEHVNKLLRLIDRKFTA